MNALEVTLVVVCPRTRWGVAVSARDTRKTKGDMEMRKEKYGRPGGKGTKGMLFVGSNERRFYQPAKRQ